MSLVTRKCIIFGEVTSRCDVTAGNIEDFVDALAEFLQISDVVREGSMLEFFDEEFSEWCALPRTLDLLPQKVKLRLFSAGLKQNGEKKKAAVLRYCHQGSKEFAHCKRFVEKHVTLEHGQAHLDCVEEVTNETLDGLFRETRALLRDPEVAPAEKILVVDSDGVEEVLSEGLCLPQTPGPFGFALCCTQKYHHTGDPAVPLKLMLCDVGVGRTLFVDGPDATVTEDVCASHGCDSVSISGDESGDVVVVFNPQQVLPRFILTVSAALVGSAPDPMKHSAVCPEHSEELKVFCSSCGTPVCLMCVHLGPHLNHPCVSVAHAHEDRTRFVNSRIDEFSFLSLGLMTQVNALQAAREHVESEAATLKERVESEANLLRALVREREEAALKMIAECAGIELENILDAENQLQSSQNIILSARAAATKALELSPVDFLSAAQSVDSTFTRALTAPLVPTKEIRVKLDLCPSLSHDLLNILQNFQPHTSTTTPPPPSAPHRAAGLLNAPAARATPKVDVSPSPQVGTTPLAPSELSYLSAKETSRLSGTASTQPHSSPTLPSPSPSLPISSTETWRHGGAHSDAEQPEEIFWASGVLVDLRVEMLKGWTLVYNNTYAHATTLRELDQVGCAGTRILVAARRRDNPGTLYVAAMGMRYQVLLGTNGVSESHAANDVFWYCKDGYSFGFSGISEVHLAAADQSDRSARSKLSWHLSGSGGFRAGKYCNLNDSKEWEKLIFVAS